MGKRSFAAQAYFFCSIFTWLKFCNSFIICYICDHFHCDAASWFLSWFLAFSFVSCNAAIILHFKFVLQSTSDEYLNRQTEIQLRQGERLRSTHRQIYGKSQNSPFATDYVFIRIHTNTCIWRERACNTQSKLPLRHSLFDSNFNSWWLLHHTQGDSELCEHNCNNVIEIAHEKMHLHQATRSKRTRG